MDNPVKKVNPAHLETSVHMLRTYAQNDEIAPLIEALDALQKDPDSAALLADAIATFNNLGLAQGLVLTYAPYVGTLVTEGLFTDEDQHDDNDVLTNQVLAKK